jgi:nucleoside-diphosphate-sugar epimerase
VPKIKKTIKKKQKKALVCGGGGFIGCHLVRDLKSRGYFVRAVDLRYPLFSKTAADEFIIGDLRKESVCKKVFDQSFDELYQLAADMGGAGYVFSGDHDAEIVQSSALINLNVAKYAIVSGAKKLFFSSSACVYPRFNQDSPSKPVCSENSAYPALPDSEYGWEKLFSERLYISHQRNFGLTVKIARFHNVFGPESEYTGGREKSLAAICRKVIEDDKGEIELWGDGKQTRSFLYIDECLKGIKKLMSSKSFDGPVNIGSKEMVTINKLTSQIIKLSGKKIKVKHITGPL